MPSNDTWYVVGAHETVFEGRKVDPADVQYLLYLCGCEYTGKAWKDTHQAYNGEPRGEGGRGCGPWIFHGLLRTPRYCLRLPVENRVRPVASV